MTFGTDVPRQLSDQNSLGTILGAGAADLIGFYGVNPGVAQATPTGVSTGFTAGSGTTATSTSTFTGGIGTTAYTVGDIVAILKTLGLLKS
jgi:hypothetical protein